MAIDPNPNFDSETKKSMLFYVSLAAVVFVTLIAGGCSFWLSSQSGLNEHQLEFLIRLNDSWHLGSTAIFGILAILVAKLLDRKSN